MLRNNGPRGQALKTSRDERENDGAISSRKLFSADLYQLTVSRDLQSGGRRQARNEPNRIQQLHRTGAPNDFAVMRRPAAPVRQAQRVFKLSMGQRRNIDRLALGKFSDTFAGPLRMRRSMSFDPAMYADRFQPTRSRRWSSKPRV
ncbi:hypothetical protein ACVBEG_27215 [Pseudomonas sp. GG8]